MSVIANEVGSLTKFFAQPEKALNDYLELGFHIEPNVLSDEQCAELIEAGLKLENAKNGTFRPQMMPHRQDEIFLTAMKTPIIAQIMGKLVNGKPVGLQTEFFYCKPGTRGFSLHQDNFYVEADYGVFASAWIALTDTYEEKGGLIVYPGSHKEGALPVQKLNMGSDASQDPNANNEETVVPPQYQKLNAKVPKGASLFLHGHLVHGSNMNKTDLWRYVILNTYIRKGEKFRPGNYAKRAEQSLD